MAVLDQTITEHYALYNGDCLEVMKDIPDGSVHMTVYSPPFAGLYEYSSDERDLSNSRDYMEFLEHYEYVVREKTRITMPGRLSLVHCMDIPTGNTGRGDGKIDFPGDIIRLHLRNGWVYDGRHHIWKEPLGVRNRTMMKGLTHQTVVEDSTKITLASSDELLRFRKIGDNPVPVIHSNGLTSYAGERQIPAELWKYRGWAGKQTENRFSHWIWRQYASSFWDDIRIKRVLPYEESREEDDEKHVHPLQRDVIERCVVLYTNVGEVVFTPFMGVGSEVHEAVVNQRLGIGAELKTSYYKQAVKNCADALNRQFEDLPLYAAATNGSLRGVEF